MGWNIMKKLLSIFLSLLLFVGCFLPAAPVTASAASLCTEHPTSPVSRVAGSTRYDTAIAIANEYKVLANIDKFPGVILANGTNFADALAGSYLSCKEQVPILLVGNTADDSKTVVNYVKNNLIHGGDVFILGGKKAVDISFEDVLDDFNITRLSGSNRYETNLAIIDRAYSPGEPILVCTGNSFADSLSASATGLPILLVGDSLLDSQRLWLGKNTDFEFIILGGTAAVSETIESELSQWGTVARLSGKNRYETSLIIARKFFPDAESAVLTYAQNFPDGLCGGLLAATIGAPLLLNTNEQNSIVQFYLNENQIQKGYVLGGASLLSDAAVQAAFGLESDTIPSAVCTVGHQCNITTRKPTCTEDGYVAHTCVRCKASFIMDTIPAGGHEWGDWEIVKDPTYTEEGAERRYCVHCTVYEERILPKLELEKDLVAWYRIQGKQVVDIISGKSMAGTQINGEYFIGGTVQLPSSYEKATIEVIMQYNKESTETALNGLSYYGGAFVFQEAKDPSNICQIQVPFGGGQIHTNHMLRPSINYDKKVFGNEDSFWALTFDKAAGNYAIQINDDYTEKQHWSNYINARFTLSSQHKFKEIKVYSTRLSEEELASHFSATHISVDDMRRVGRIEDGITGLGSALSFTKYGVDGIPEWLDTSDNKGDYFVTMASETFEYSNYDFEAPDLGIDNSKYDSVHIIKKPDTLYVDYKYALSAVPYPFNVNHSSKSDQYDVVWSSSNESVAIIVDGLVIPQKVGSVTITATLRGTDISDSCTIEIIDKVNGVDKTINISSKYISKNGYSFSKTDYEQTTRAIYDAIDEAYYDGYNHIVFPEIDFYAVPLKEPYYIPTGMTVEFPKGSTFNMMPSDLAKDGYTFFQMGWGWWSCNIPTEKADADYDANGNLLAYYCRDAHLIIDKYYGEFYESNATMKELYTGANQYAWGCTLLSMGKRAEYCSVEVREANCPSGFFITMGGKGNSEVVNGEGGSVKSNEFVSGWLNDNGEIEPNSNWISTDKFYTVSLAANGMDTLHKYYIGNWEHNVTAATQHLYDILWYDVDYKLIRADRWQYVDEGYTKPADAKYFKLSIQQSDLPSGTDEYVRLCPDESTRFCEIKNTNVINGADGLASVVGATEACWIHHNYTSGDGLLNGSCWSLDLEDGWQGMRGTIIENNIFRKYVYSGSVGDYRGMDTGVLALSSGYNTFVISNYLGAIAQSNGNVVNSHIINNVIYTMYSSISGGKSKDINPKIYAHVYNNIISDKNILTNDTGNGVVYHANNKIVPATNVW